MISGSGRCRPSKYAAERFTHTPPESVPADARRGLDAIIIPTHRNTPIFWSQLDSASKAAQCTIVLASHAAPAAPADGRGLPEGVVWLADLPIGSLHDSWRIACRSCDNPSRQVNGDYDLPLKRNLGLQLARSNGFKRICFLDDDIIVGPEQLKLGGCALSEDAPIAGYYVFDFPDVSTIEHIEARTIGTELGTMPGGNCLFVMPEVVRGFFPYIYNDDWFFVMSNVSATKGLALGDVKQLKSAPWRDERRSRFEEFGETILEGVLSTPSGWDLAILTSGEKWNRILDYRRTRLNALLRCARSSSYRQSVASAIETSMSVRAEDCTSFIEAMMYEVENDLCNLPLLNLKLK